MFNKKNLSKLFLVFVFCMFTSTVFANEEAQDALRNSIRESVQDAADVAVNYAEVSFYYNEGQLYQIYCRPGYLTDIKLHTGEDILFIGGGDTARWVIDNSKVGGTPHLYIKPTKVGIATNLIVNTTKHTYQMQITAVEDWYNPIVSWQYSQEENMAKLAKEAKDDAFYAEKSLALTSPELLNFDYRIEKKDYSWTPISVFDDNHKTYIKLPTTLSTGDAPVIFVKEGKMLSLVNARMKGNFLIVDRLVNEIVMRSNTKDSITIKRKG